LKEKTDRILGPPKKSHRKRSFEERNGSLREDLEKVQKRAKMTRPQLSRRERENITKGHNSTKNQRLKIKSNRIEVRKRRAARKG